MFSVCICDYGTWHSKCVIGSYELANRIKEKIQRDQNNRPVEVVPFSILPSDEAFLISSGLIDPKSTTE